MRVSAPLAWVQTPTPLSKNLFFTEGRKGGVCTQVTAPHATLSRVCEFYLNRTLTLSPLMVVKEEYHNLKFKFLFVKSEEIVNHAKGLSKRFHVNGNTIGFRSQI